MELVSSWSAATEPLLQQNLVPLPYPQLGPTVLLATGNAALRRHVTRALVSIGCDVDARPLTEAAIASLPKGRRDMFVVDAEDALCQRFVSAIKKRSPAAPVLGLSRQIANPILWDMVSNNGISNLIARHGGFSATDEMIDETELITTCHKVFTNDIFGIGQYLSSMGARIHHQEVRGSQDKERALGRLTVFLDRLCCHRSISRDVITVADELLSNAIYNAPCDADGRPKYMMRERSRDLELSLGEEAEVSFACDGRHVALSVRDRFGRLDRESILRYLKPYLMNERATVNDKTGGAGIGLTMVMTSITQLVFNIAPGRCTEVIALFYIRSNPKAYRNSGRSLNIFVAP